jgi:hypothetical protein
MRCLNDVYFEGNSYKTTIIGLWYFQTAVYVKKCAHPSLRAVHQRTLPISHYMQHSNTDTHIFWTHKYCIHASFYPINYRYFQTQTSKIQTQASSAVFCAERLATIYEYQWAMVTIVLQNAVFLHRCNISCCSTWRNKIEIIKLFESRWIFYWRKLASVPIYP